MWLGEFLGKMPLPSVLPTLSFPHGRTRGNPSLDRPLGALPVIKEVAIFGVIPNGQCNDDGIC